MLVKPLSQNNMVCLAPSALESFGHGKLQLIALLNLSVLRFSFVFHDKAKSTQQGNLLGKLQRGTSSCAEVHFS